MFGRIATGVNPENAWTAIGPEPLQPDNDPIVPA